MRTPTRFCAAIFSTWINAKIRDQSGEEGSELPKKLKRESLQKPKAVPKPIGPFLCNPTGLIERPIWIPSSQHVYLHMFFSFPSFTDHHYFSLFWKQTQKEKLSPMWWSMVEKRTQKMKIRESKRDQGYFQPGNNWRIFSPSFNEKMIIFREG